MTSNTLVCKYCRRMSTHYSEPMYIVCLCNNVPKYAHASCFHRWLKTHVYGVCEYCLSRTKIVPDGIKRMRDWKLKGKNKHVLLYPISVLIFCVTLIAYLIWWFMVSSYPLMISGIVFGILLLLLNISLCLCFCLRRSKKFWYNAFNQNRNWKVESCEMPSTEGWNRTTSEFNYDPDTPTTTGNGGVFPEEMENHDKGSNNISEPPTIEIYTNGKNRKYNQTTWSQKHSLNITNNPIYTPRKHHFNFNINTGENLYLESAESFNRNIKPRYHVYQRVSELYLKSDKNPKTTSDDMNVESIRRGIIETYRTTRRKKNDRDDRCGRNAMVPFYEQMNKHKTSAIVHTSEHLSESSREDRKKIVKSASVPNLRDICHYGEETLTYNPTSFIRRNTSVNKEKENDAESSILYVESEMSWPSKLPSVRSMPSNANTNRKRDASKYFADIFSREEIESVNGRKDSLEIGRVKTNKNTDVNISFH